MPMGTRRLVCNVMVGQVLYEYQERIIISQLLFPRSKQIGPTHPPAPMLPEASLAPAGEPSPCGRRIEELSPEEAKQRIKEIMSDARLAPIQTEFSRIPLYCRRPTAVV